MSCTSPCAVFAAGLVHVRTAGQSRPSVLFVLLPVAMAMLLAGCGAAATVRIPTATPTSVELMQVTLPATPTPLVVLAPPTAPPTPMPSATPTSAPEEGVVVEVVTGDTLRVLIQGDEQLVRMVGVQSPPLSDALGPLAVVSTQGMVQGQLVRLVRDITNQDGSRRLMRYIYRQSDDLFVNAEVVRQGWGRAIAGEPDTAQQQVLEDAETQAAAAAVGIWVAKRGPATNQDATLYAGPGVDFAVVANLPTNTALQIDAVSPDGLWFRVAGTQWIPDFFVVNAPPATSLPLAAVPTPTPNWTPTPVPTPREPTPTPTPVPTFAIGAIKIIQLERLNEYFVLRNDTIGAIALLDWKLKSENGSEICFLSGVIGPGGLARFWSKSDAPPPDYSCNLEWEMWADLDDDTAILFDPSGKIVDTKKNPIYTPPVGD